MTLKCIVLFQGLYVCNQMCNGGTNDIWRSHKSSRLENNHASRTWFNHQESYVGFTWSTTRKDAHTNKWVFKTKLVVDGTVENYKLG